MSSLPVKFFGAGPAGKPQWPTVADSAPADSDGDCDSESDRRRSESQAAAGD